MSRKKETLLRNSVSAHERCIFDKVFSCSLMQTLKKWSGHGLFPVLISAAVAADGRMAIEVRSIAILACALWVLLDTGTWLTQKEWSAHSKGIVFCLVGCMSFCLACACMYWFLDSVLAAQRANVWADLQASSFFLPGGSGDPMQTFFSVTNGGKYEISREHGITCRMNLSVNMFGVPSMSGFSTQMRNGHMYVFSGVPSEFDHLADSPLLPGGDAQSDTCLKYWGGFRGAAAPVCTDVTILFWYSLSNQPEYHQEKDFRFVAYRGTNGRYSWVHEPIEEPRSYCAAYIRHPKLHPNPF